MNDARPNKLSGLSDEFVAGVARAAERQAGDARPAPPDGYATWLDFLTADGPRAAMDRLNHEMGCVREIAPSPSATDYARAELAALRQRLDAAERERDKFQMIAEEATDVCRSVQQERDRLLKFAKTEAAQFGCRPGYPQCNTCSGCRARAALAPEAAMDAFEKAYLAWCDTAPPDQSNKDRCRHFWNAATEDRAEWTAKAHALLTRIARGTRQLDAATRDAETIEVEKLLAEWPDCNSRPDAQ